MAMKGYKGFGPGMVCRGKQYAENTVFDAPEAKICESGMHFCVPPLGVLRYYPPVDNEGRISEYAEVEAEADSSTDDEIEYTTTKLRVGAKISLAELAEAHVEWVKTQTTGVPVANTDSWSVAANTGYRSVAANTGSMSVATNAGSMSVATNAGYGSVAANAGGWSVAASAGECSVAANTGSCSVAANAGECSVAGNTGGWSAATNAGDMSVATSTGCESVATNTGSWSVAASTGYRSVAEVSGAESVAIVTGRDSKVRGALGCWIVATEHDAGGHILCVNAACVDGKKIKADTWYKLENGEFVEVDNG